MCSQLKRRHRMVGEMLGFSPPFIYYSVDPSDDSDFDGKAACQWFFCFEQ